MTQVIKKYRSLILACAFVIFLVLCSTFVPKWLVLRDVEATFNEAFEARRIGNCEKFLSFVTAESQNYFSNGCQKEKDNDSDSLLSWDVVEIQIDGGRAYIRAMLFRDSRELKIALAAKGHDLPDEGYQATYEAFYQDEKWLIHTTQKVTN